MLPPILLGKSDFKGIRQQGGLYVDKSGFAIEVIRRYAEVQLYPRPRRFGKTTNLSMLRYFFDPGEDLSALFSDLKVWQDPLVRAEFQKHPVIWLSFKDVKLDRWEVTEKVLLDLVAREVDRLRPQWDRPALPPSLRRSIQAIEEGKAAPTQILLPLCEALQATSGQGAVILIDEYDTPLLNAYEKGFFDPAVSWFRAFLTSGLKDNPALYRAVLTGILRVAKESLFSGLNNIAVYSILGSEENEAFGFTEPEVQALLQLAGREAELPEVRRWYNGYVFCNTTVYNPWSITTFLRKPGEPCMAHWLNTSDNALVRELLLGQADLSSDIETLLVGGSIESVIDEHVTLRNLGGDAVWSLLLLSGYLKVVKARVDTMGRRHATLAVPNVEVMSIWRDSFRAWLYRGQLPRKFLYQALLGGDADTLEKMLGNLLLTHVSFHDMGRPEVFYHAFVLGLLVDMEESHRVRSNREVGYGRTDVVITPKKVGDPGIVLEFKQGENLAILAEAALQQIHDKKYDHELEKAGVTPIRRYGIAFSGKGVAVRGG